MEDSSRLAAAGLTRGGPSLTLLQQLRLTQRRWEALDPGPTCPQCLTAHRCHPPPPLPRVQVATARVKGAAKVEIPHVDDHVSKIECVGVQTQKKLEDIRGASVAAGVPDLRIPINSVTKGGWWGWAHVRAGGWGGGVSGSLRRGRRREGGHQELGVC